MEIKISLKNLYAGFQASASDESLGKAERVLASRCCVLVAHISRVEGLAASMNKHVLEIMDARFAKFMEELGAELSGVTQSGGEPAADTSPIEGDTPPATNPAAAKPPVQTTPPAPMPPRGKPRAPVPPKVEIDEETELTVGGMLADTEAELRAIEAQNKAPLRAVPAPTGGNAS